MIGPGGENVPPNHIRGASMHVGHRVCLYVSSNLFSVAVAILVFLATTAWAKIVSLNLGKCF